MDYVLNEFASVTPYELAQVVEGYCRSSSGIPVNNSAVSKDEMRERFAATLHEHPEMEALRAKHVRLAEEDAVRMEALRAERAARPPAPPEPEPEPPAPARYRLSVDRFGAKNWQQLDPGEIYHGKTYSAEEMRAEIEQAGAYR